MVIFNEFFFHFYSIQQITLVKNEANPMKAEKKSNDTGNQVLMKQKVRCKKVTKTLVTKRNDDMVKSERKRRKTK